MEQDSTEAISTLPEYEEVRIPTVQEDDRNVAELSAEHEDNRKEAVSSAVQEDTKIEEDFPAEQVDDRTEAETSVVQEVMNTRDDGNSVEKCGKESCRKKTSRVLRVKQKNFKKSPAGSLLKTRKAQGELEDVKKEKEVPTAQELKETLEAGNSAEKCSKSESPMNKNHTVQEDDGNDTELSAEHEDNGKEAVSSAVQEDTKIEEEFPLAQVNDRKEAEAPVVQEVMNTHDDGNSAEKCSNVESCRDKNSKVLNVKRKILKKSLAGSLLKTRKAQDEPEVVKKEKEVPASQDVKETLEPGNSAEKCSKSVSSKKKNLTVKEDGSYAELSAEHEDNKKEAVSSAVQEDTKIEEGFSSEQVDDRKEAQTPVAQEVMNTHNDGNSSEKCSKAESCRKKTSEVLNVKGKILKKPPAGSLLKARKAQGEPEDVKKEKEVPAVQEVKATLEAGNSTEKCSKLESSTKKNDRVLKVKQKIAKKAPACSLLKSNKAQRSLTVQTRRKKNNKNVSRENGESTEQEVEDAEQLNGEDSAKNSVSKGGHIEKSEETHNGQKRISELKNSCQEPMNEQKDGPSDKSKHQKNKQNNNVEKVQRKKNEKKLGGMIFMCSAKTRPDCFHYRVMGVSAGKKDLVLAIKPGLKLFLYDFDLKLLYGIYRASSSGGMKLESKAFHGAFPAQVRFKVYKDCIPLPENIFKKAIKENFYAKHKFKAELTVRQVTKLSRLFRPVGFLSNAAAVQSPLRAPIRDRTVHGGVKVRSRDSNSKGNARNYRLAHERDRKVAYRDEAPRQREEASHDLYLSEKEYRSYGLRTERRHLDPVPRPALETYHRDYDRDYHLRHPEPMYRDLVSAQIETVCVDPVYFNGKDYPVYSIGPRPELSPPRARFASSSERYAYDSYYAHEYGPPSMDPYLLPSRREEVSPLAYSSRNHVVDTESVTHAARALSYYNQRHPENLETGVVPVSSPYSFAGPSYSCR